MPRVKCPHCGAGNQDATEDDTCWQCGNILGAPIARTAEAVQNPGTSAPTQQLDPSLLKTATQATQQTRSANGSQRVTTVALVVAVLVIAALMILIFVMLSKG